MAHLREVFIYILYYLYLVMIGTNVGVVLQIPFLS